MVYTRVQFGFQPFGITPTFGSWRRTIAFNYATSLFRGDPNIPLLRTGTAAALTAASFPISDKILAIKTSRGNGLPYRLFGRVPHSQQCPLHLATFSHRRESPGNGTAANDG
jgi:hypothetical protein